MKKQLTQREKIIAILCAAVLGIFVSKYFIVDFLNKRKETISLKIQEQEKLLIRNLESINIMKDQDNEYKQYMSLLTSTQSEESEMSGMLSEVEQIAGDVGIKIIQMKPRRVRAIDFYRTSSLEITAEAALPEMMNFLYQLEGNAKPFLVEEMRLEKKPAYQVDQVSLNCNLVLSRIFVKEKDVETLKR